MIRQEILKEEIKKMSDDMFQEAVDFVRFFKTKDRVKKNEIAIQVKVP